MRKPEPITVRGTCVECLANPQKGKGRTLTGQRTYNAKCSTCINRARKTAGRKQKQAKGARYAYTVHKKDHCEDCGFVPVHPCQLDVDHMDGDHGNDDLENLRTRCANCHRLKTFLAGEMLPMAHRQVGS